MWQKPSGHRSDILTLLPAYNEEESIARVIHELSLYVPLTDILVVDDGSQDNTSLKTLHAGAELLRLPCNLGVGAALQAGLRFAEEQGYSYVLRLDADGQHDPEDAFRLLSAVMAGEADAAIGSRFLGTRWLGKDRNYHTTISRSLGIRLFAGLVTLFTGQPTSDPTSGLRCYNRKVIRFLARYHPQDYPEVESTIMLRRSGFRVLELPATIHPRVAGRSTIDTWKSVYYAFRVLLAILVAALRAPLTLPEEEIYVS
jgi:glycosyltransferase involved in cell wall biosynthesis